MDLADDRGPLDSYSTVEDVVGPLADYTLRAPESFVPASRQRRTRRRRSASRHRRDGEAFSPGTDSAAPSHRAGDQRRRGPATSHTSGVARELRPVQQLRRRLTAGVLDLALLGGINAAVVYFTTRLVGLPLTAVGQLPLVPLIVFLAVLDVGYAAALTAAGGQTVGKMAAGLRVEAGDGSAVPPLHALVRTLAYVISVLPFGLGFVGMFLPSHRALHDRLADTRVVALSAAA